MKRRPVPVENLIRAELCLRRQDRRRIVPLAKAEMTRPGWPEAGMFGSDQALPRFSVGTSLLTRSNEGVRGVTGIAWRRLL